MTKLEFAAALTHCTKPGLTSYSDLAVFAQADGTVIGGGMHEGDPKQIHETAIANLCFKLNDSGLKDTWCLTTYQPTEICKGIMNVRQMKAELVVKIPETKVIGSTPLSGIVTRGAAPPDDWRLKPQTWLDAVTKAFQENRLSPAAKAIYNSYNSCPWVTSRTLPEDVYETFSRLPASTPPVKQSSWADEIFMRLAFAMVGQTWNPVIEWDAKDSSGERFGGNNVGAVIVLNNKIVAWGLNLAAQNRTLHAETLAILVYLRRNNATKLPKKCKIYTSLQPCRMCAAHIAQLGDGIEVVVGVKDGGLKTILDAAPNARVNGCFEGMAKLSVNPGAKSTQQVEAKDLEIVKGRTIKGEIEAAKQLKPGKATTKIMTSDQDVELRNKRLRKQRLGLNLTPSTMGNTFAAYAKWLIENRNKPRDPTDLALFKQSVDLLKIIAVNGLTTSYGIGAILPLFDEIYNEEKARLATV